MELSKKEYHGKSLWDILDWENRMYLLMAIVSIMGLTFIISYFLFR